MTILHIPSENRSLRQYDEIRDFLAVIGIDYERWEPVAAVTSWEQILDVYSKPINELKRRGGRYRRDTAGLDAMLAKFITIMKMTSGTL